MPILAKTFAPAAAAITLGFLLLVDTAQAQIPEPPSTFAGTITAEDGAIPAGVRVEAIVNNQVCGTSETVYEGQGASRVTFYVVDVVSHSQTPGCGRPGDTVQIRVGDRLSTQSIPWEQGLVIHNVTFGDVTPAPIPTTTPTPVGGGQPPATSETSPQDQQTPGSGGQGGSGGDSPDSDGGSASPTLEGQLTSTTPGAEGSAGAIVTNEGGGFPVWAVFALAVGGIAVAGGGIGYMMARGNRNGAASEDGDVAGYDPDDVDGGEDYTFDSDAEDEDR